MNEDEDIEELLKAAMGGYIYKSITEKIQSIREAYG